MSFKTQSLTHTDKQLIPTKLCLLSCLLVYTVGCLQIEPRIITEMDMGEMTSQDATIDTDMLGLDLSLPDMLDADSFVDDMLMPRCGDGEVQESEQCDDGNQEIGDGCDSQCQWEADLCDGLDNNQDGQIDELIYDTPSSLSLVFSARTGVDPQSASISILDRFKEHIAGSPFTGPELSGLTVNIPGNGFFIRIEVGEAAMPTFGYEIEQVLDQNGRLIEGPYPSLDLGEMGMTPIPFYDEQNFSAGDSSGAGFWCGEGTGVCQIGMLTCLGGILFCTDEVEATTENCDNLDNDCDGKVDEIQDLDPQLCERQDGICSGLMEICDQGQWRCPYEQLSEYQEQEEGCDCLDNNCDGFIDQNGEQDLSCAFVDVIQGGELGRDCTVHVDSDVESGIYRFGSLTINEDVELLTQASGRIMVGGRECGGFQGKNLCAQGGGCLLLSAQRISINGKISVNADEIQPSDTFNVCGGGSGGDLLIEADEFYLDGTLEANGANGWQAENVTISQNTGGGAGGSIKIQAKRIEFGETALIRSVGGSGSIPNEPLTNAAGGAGKAGGAKGGAGSGGDGGTNAGPPNPNRGVALTGEIVLPTDPNVNQFDYLETLADQIQVSRIDGIPFGHLDLGGSALALSPLLPNLDTREFPFIAHLTDQNGQAFTQQSIQIFSSEDGEDWANPINIGQTNQFGWLMAEASTFTPSSMLEYKFNLINEPEASGYLFYNYYDTMGQVNCADILFFENSHAVLGSIIDCD